MPDSKGRAAGLWVWVPSKPRGRGETERRGPGPQTGLHVDAVSCERIAEELRALGVRVPRQRCACWALSPPPFFLFCSFSRSRAQNDVVPVVAWLYRQQTSITIARANALRGLGHLYWQFFYTVRTGGDTRITPSPRTNNMSTVRFDVWRSPPHVSAPFPKMDGCQRAPGQLHAGAARRHPTLTISCWVSASTSTSVIVSSTSPRTMFKC